MQDKRQMDVFNQRQVSHSGEAGDDDIPVDMAFLPCWNNSVKGQACKAGEFREVQGYTHQVRCSVRSHTDKMAVRQQEHLMHWRTAMNLMSSTPLKRPGASSGWASILECDEDT